MTKEHAYKIFKLLEQHYPQAKMILKWSNPWELMVAIILSAQCTDVMVNKVTAVVFPKYKKEKQELRNKYQGYEEKIKLQKEQLIEIVNFAFVSIIELEQDVKSTGFYKNKAKNVQAAAKVVLERYNGVFPETIAELLTIPGVGRKTANVFLGNAYHIYEGIAVDTHVIKQAQALGLTKETKPEKIEKDLMELYDQKDWFKLTYMLIEHGRNVRRRMSDRIVCGKKDCTLCSK